MMNMIIDTHIHIWDLDRVRYEWLDAHTGILRQNWSLEALQPERVAAGITGGILVQAANNSQDTLLMLEAAAHNNWIRGVVGWLPLTDPQATAKGLKEMASKKVLKGLRHLIHDEHDPRWLLQPAVIESLSLAAQAGLCYDVVGVLPEHIRTALQVAEKVPELRMVFDHINQPPKDIA